MGFETYTIAEYIASKEDLKAKIFAVDNMIDAMMLSMAEAIGGQAPTISEYNLDDGQIKIKTVYRSILDVKNGINALESLKQMYMNRLKGRNIILRNEQTFRR